MLLQTENSDSDQTVQMHRLIFIFTVCTCQLVPYAGYRLNLPLMEEGEVKLKQKLTKSN